MNIIRQILTVWEQWIQILAARNEYVNIFFFFEHTDKFLPFFFLALIEVVLAVLIPTFKFELSNKEIYWNFTGVQYPTVGTESTKAEMFLRLSLLKSL